MSDLSRTALIAAQVRAREGERADRLFYDPYAAPFVAAVAPDVNTDVLGPSAAGLTVHVIVRTRFYDEYLLTACAAGCGQVVLLAAGLDTRAFRLDWPEGVRLFELDLAPVLSFKDGVLEAQSAVARCRRLAVVADLRADWPARLTHAGFDPVVPTAWLIEGLLVYLSSEDAGRILGAVGSLSAPVSRLACESAGVRAKTPLRALWKGGLGRNTPRWLDDHGWRTELHALSAIASAFGRPVPDGIESTFVTASR